MAGLTVPAHFCDPCTRPIVRRIFCVLLDGEVRRRGEVVRMFEVDLGSRGEREAEMIRRVSDKVCEIVTKSPNISIRRNVQQFAEQHWEVSHADAYSEFHKVVEVTFRGEADLVSQAACETKVNWGRVISFLVFAVSFAAYVERKGLPCEAVQSVEAWTTRVIETTLAEFFIDEDGWNGFIKYADVFLQRLRRPTNGHSELENPPFWQLAMAAGALGLMAFTFKQAFS